jgi:hypothetical protein
MQSFGQVLETLPSSARKFADPQSPVAVRTMAAGGTLPLPPPQIVTVLCLLAQDPESHIAERACATLAKLPPHVMEAALGVSLHAVVLAHLARLHTENEPYLTKIALNAATDDDTFCQLAALPFPGLIEIVAANQTRLLRCARILDVLSENPVTRQSTLDRILEFLGIETDETSAPPDVAIPEPADGTASDDDAFDPNDPKDLPDECLIDVDAAESPEEAEERARSIFAVIQKMNVMQKIKLARFGNAEARAILVRDRNKLVSGAAIRSPKLGETEVTSFAKSRSISDEILRVIGSSRQWTRSHAVKLALVMNPKTPLPTAMKFIQHLSDSELKQIMKSKDVAAQISAHSRRILMKKGKV